MRFSEEEIMKLIAEKIFSLTLKKVASPGDELIDTGILNSITLAELAVELEAAFSISLSFMEINKENFRSVMTISKLILEKLKRPQ